jgi:hypothetical protein
MMKILKMIKIAYRDRRIIRELCKHQSTFIKIKDSKREAVIRKGMRQGCNLSPLLFNIYIEQAIKECKEYCAGIKVNRMRIQMLRFADYIPIIAQDEIYLKRALESLNNILKNRYKIKINKKQVLVCYKDFENINIKMDDCALRQVSNFKYLLGSTIKKRKKNREDIVQRIREAKLMFNNKKLLLCSNNFSLEMKKTLIKSCIWSVALYGSETWTLGKNEERVINAFETRCWRKMLKIKWTDRITNKEVWVKEERLLLKMLNNGRHLWIGHIIRHSEFVVNILEGAISGKKAMGRPRLQYLKQVDRNIEADSYTTMKKNNLQQIQMESCQPIKRLNKKKKKKKKKEKKKKKKKKKTFIFKSFILYFSI